MAWWVWILFGSALLCSEILLVDLGFYLFFLGVAALGVGALQFGVVDLPLWAQWLLFAALSVLFIVLLRRRLYEKLRGAGPPVASQPVAPGDRGTAIEAIAPGTRGRAEVGGSTWTAENAGAAEIPAGARLRVRAADGLVLKVEAAAAAGAAGGSTPAAP